MKPILFCIPLKKNCLNQYQSFVKQSLKEKEAYKEMLNRYDIHSAKIWYTNFNDRDYVFVYHDVGSQFEEKMKGWDTSEHPFDKWFRESIMSVYDINNAGGMKMLHNLANFKA